jgi:hypothetical protein
MFAAGVCGVVLWRSCGVILVVNRLIGMAIGGVYVTIMVREFNVTPAAEPDRSRFAFVLQVVPWLPQVFAHRVARQK